MLKCIKFRDFSYTDFKFNNIYDLCQSSLVRGLKAFCITLFLP